MKLITAPPWIEPPMFIELEVKETTPNIKGAAVQNTSKNSRPCWRE